MALIEWGLPFVAWLQALPAWATPVMRLLSRVGDVETYAVVVAAVLWSVDATVGYRAGLLFLAYGCLNSPMKIALGLPRPYWVSDQVRALAPEVSYGLPSGHAGFAAAVLGRFAVATRAPALRAALLGLVVAIGVSRVALGVHWPADVLAGWAAGGLLLAVALHLEQPLRRRVGAWPLAAQVVGALVVSSAVIGVALAIAALRAGPVPAAWLAGAQRALPGEGGDLAPNSIAGVLNAAGTLFGFLVGGALLHRGGGFDAGGPVSARLARLVVGSTGLALLAGVRSFAPLQPTVVLAAVELAVFALVGAWLTFGAPMLFLRLGLARRGGREATTGAAGSVRRGSR